MSTSIPIGVLLKITEKEFEKRLNEKAFQLGLTTAQMHVLQFICRNSGQVCQRDLEQEFNLSHATVSGLIARLECKQFIKTKQDAADKRRKVLFATGKADDCDSEINAFIENADPQMMHGFSNEERVQFRSLLYRILKNMDVELPARQKNTQNV